MLPSKRQMLYKRKLHTLHGHACFPTPGARAPPRRLQACSTLGT